jgi:hypothetical protein
MIRNYSSTGSGVLQTTSPSRAGRSVTAVAGGSLFKDVSSVLQMGAWVDGGQTGDRGCEGDCSAAVLAYLNGGRGRGILEQIVEHRDAPSEEFACPA